MNDNTKPQTDAARAEIILKRRGIMSDRSTQVISEDKEDELKLPGTVIKIDEHTFEWDPAETLEIDPSRFHFQASK